jgi:soluble lytic murein transglycosylase-like protein
VESQVDDFNFSSVEDFETFARDRGAPSGDRETTQDAGHLALLSDMIEEVVPAHPEKKTIASIIVRESRKAQLDPLFVASVVRTESMFKHKAVSSRGARGLMQIMPETGRYIAKLINIDFKNVATLHNPETNIQIGVWYLKYLLSKFKGNREQMLVAYNWGPANLSKALSTGGAFPEESRKYVRKVIAEHSTWSARLTRYAATARSTSVG